MNSDHSFSQNRMGMLIESCALQLLRSTVQLIPCQKSLRILIVAPDSGELEPNMTPQVSDFHEDSQSNKKNIVDTFVKINKKNNRIQMW